MTTDSTRGQPELTRIILLPIVQAAAVNHPEFDFQDHINHIMEQGYTIGQAYTVAYAISTAVSKNEELGR